MRSRCGRSGSSSRTASGWRRSSSPPGRWRSTPFISFPAGAWCRSSTSCRERCSSSHSLRSRSSRTSTSRSPTGRRCTTSRMTRRSRRSRSDRSSRPPTERRTRRHLPRAAASSCSCSREDTSGDLFVGTSDGLERLAPESVTVENGAIVAAEGYDVLKGNDLFTIDAEINALKIPTGKDTYIKSDGLTIANEVVTDPRLRPRERHVQGHRDRHRLLGQRRRIVRVRRGCRARARLAHARRFSELQDDPHRPAHPRPLCPCLHLDVRVRILSVLIQFAIGLFLAITLNKPGLKLRRTNALCWCCRSRCPRSSRFSSGRGS